MLPCAAAVHTVLLQTPVLTADFPFLPKTAGYEGNSGLFRSGSEARGLLASATQRKTLQSTSLPCPGVVSPLLPPF